MIPHAAMTRKKCKYRNAAVQYQRRTDNTPYERLLRLGCSGCRCRRAIFFTIAGRAAHDGAGDDSAMFLIGFLRDILDHVGHAPAHLPGIP